MPPLILLTLYPGFCPEFKSIGTNGPLSLKKVGHFRKYGALVNFPYMTLMVYQHLDHYNIHNKCIRIPWFENYRQHVTK